MVNEQYPHEADEATQAEHDAKSEPIVQGEYLVDPDTGEVLGLVNRPKFEVNDLASAEWVLEKMQTEDVEIMALQARLKALTENMATMIKAHQQKRAWLEMRFGPELAHYAKDNMPKGKKTWTCPYGQISFRSTNAKLAVRDEERILDWARQFEPQAVKTTEKFQIGSLSDAARAQIMDSPTLADSLGFDIVPAGENTSIKTGI